MPRVPKTDDGGKASLTAKRVQALKAPGKYHDLQSRGLHLQIGPRGHKSWLLRYEFQKREHWLGLGSAADFSLREARERARSARQLLADGIDPLAQKRAARAASVAEAARVVTFREAARRFLEQHAAKWESTKHAGQWRITLRDYAEPILGDLPVAAIDVPLVLKVLEQPVKADRHRPAGTLWATRAVTAGRLRGRIEAVMDWAKARGYRTGDNPAGWSIIGKVLPGHASDSHHAALDYKAIPEFMQRLRQSQGSAARALEFLIHTATRAQEALGAQWREINLAEGTWVIPASRMKMRREHRVPLSPEMVTMLRQLPREGGDEGFLFLGAQPGKPISRATVSVLLKSLEPAVTLHGMRSAFRDWAGERTAFPHDVCEAALAHIKGKTERAYARGDLFEKRRKLMASWSSYCELAPVGSAKITMLREAVS